MAVHFHGRIRRQRFATFDCFQTEGTEIFQAQFVSFPVLETISENMTLERFAETTFGQVPDYVYRVVEADEKHRRVKLKSLQSHQVRGVFDHDQVGNSKKDAQKLCKAT